MNNNPSSVSDSQAPQQQAEAMLLAGMLIIARPAGAAFVKNSVSPKVVCARGTAAGSVGQAPTHVYLKIDPALNPPVPGGVGGGVVEAAIATNDIGEHVWRHDAVPGADCADAPNCAPNRLHAWATFNGEATQHAFTDFGGRCAGATDCDPATAIVCAQPLPGI